MVDPAIGAVIEGYAAAVRAKDVDAFVSLYAKDVRVFDMWGRWSYDGVDAWRSMAGRTGLPSSAGHRHDVRRPAVKR